MKNRGLIGHVYCRLPTPARSVCFADWEQEGVIVLRESAAIWSPKRGVKFSTFACVMLRNRLVELSRKSDHAKRDATDPRNRTGRLSASAFREPNDPEDPRTHSLRAALDRLAADRPDEYQAVIRRRVLGHKLREIAGDAGVTNNGVWLRERRGLHRLAAALGSPFDPHRIGDRQTTPILNGD